MRIYKISNKQKAQYVGNCTNIFDENTGECLLDIFTNVSEFTVKEEEIRKQIENNTTQTMTMENFTKQVNIQPIIPIENLNENFEFYTFPQTIYSPRIFVAYDMKNDIHHFFI